MLYYQFWGEKNSTVGVTTWICIVHNICDACVICTDHGITQYVGGLAQFVFWDSAVEQDGLQQAGVVQVNVIVPFLQSQNTCNHTFSPLSCLLSKPPILLYNENLSE